MGLVLNTKETVVELLKYVGSANRKQIESLTDIKQNTLNKVIPNLVREETLIKRNGNKKIGEMDTYYLRSTFLQMIGCYQYSETWDFVENYYCVEKIIKYKTWVESKIEKKVSFNTLFNNFLTLNYFQRRIKENFRHTHEYLNEAELVLDFHLEGERIVRTFLYIKDNLVEEKHRYKTFLKSLDEMQEENEDIVIVKPELYSISEFNLNLIRKVDR